ncbi:MAG: hypothetical protein Ta2A_21510 [Treponemataceae bacterium]|nr:MAG: hypothetical protein Ta2A_21510 [Treponemataceae bacterium]
MKKNQEENATLTAGSSTGNFESRLERLEFLSDEIRKSNITLESALSYFEEGITLARGMEKELDKIEGKIQILLNGKEVVETGAKPAFDLFSDCDA